MKIAKTGDNRNIRVLQFLEAYEKEECLWNPALESYKNKVARDEAYTNIIHELNSPSLTIQDVKLKVKSIRTTYTKELRLLTKYKKEGRVYNPKLFWFNRANSFLKNVSLSREKRTSQSYPSKLNAKMEVYKSCDIDYVTEEEHQDKIIIEETATEDESNVEEDDPDRRNTSSPYEYKTIPNSELDVQIEDDLEMTDTQEEMDVSNVKQAEYQAQSEYQHQSGSSSNSLPVKSNRCISVAESSPRATPATLLPTQSTLISSCGNTSDDEYDLFCRSVAAQLRSISDNYSRSVAKLKIQQILFEAETGHYRTNPCITIPVNQQLSSL